MFKHTEEARNNEFLKVLYTSSEDDNINNIKQYDIITNSNQEILKKHNIKQLTIYYNNYEPETIILITNVNNSTNCYNILDTRDLPIRQSTELFNKIKDVLYRDPTNFKKYINKELYERKKGNRNYFTQLETEESLIARSPLNTKLLVLYVSLFLVTPNQELIKLFNDISNINNIYLKPKKAI